MFQPIDVDHYPARPFEVDVEPHRATIQNRVYEMLIKRIPQPRPDHEVRFKRISQCLEASLLRESLTKEEYLDLETMDMKALSSRVRALYEPGTRPRRLRRAFGGVLTYCKNDCQCEGCLDMRRLSTFPGYTFISLDNGSPSTFKSSPPPAAGEVWEEVKENFPVPTEMSKPVPIKDAVKVLNAMDGLPKAGAFRYFASFVILDDKKRDFFMKLDPDQRLPWLQSEFEASKEENS